MNDGAALFQAILEDPEDTGLRLVYADWLEEHGDADRAEFIRVQGRLGGMAEDDERWPGLEARQHALFNRRWRDWVAPLESYIPNTLPEFRRGFVEGICLGLPQFIENKESLCRLAPIREVSLSDYKVDRIAHLAASPQLGRISDLDLRRIDIGDEGLAVLLQSPYLCGLKSLRLNTRSVSVNGMRVLAASPLLARLEFLALQRLTLGATGLEVLTSSPALQRLTGLEIIASRLGTAGLQFLAA